MGEPPVPPKILAHPIRFLHHHHATIGPWNSTTNQQQIAFRIHAYHGQVARRNLHVTQMARHALALFWKTATAPRRQAAAGTHVAMHLFHTVRGSLTAKAVTLHDTRES